MADRELHAILEIYRACSPHNLPLIYLLHAICTTSVDVCDASGAVTKPACRVLLRAVHATLVCNVLPNGPHADE